MTSNYALERSVKAMSERAAGAPATLCAARSTWTLGCAMASRCFLFALLPVAVSLAAAADPRLSYDGFDLDSTVETAKQRYPNSNFNGTSFEVASSDSRGLVRYVAFQDGRILIGLGSNAVDDAIKPRCFDVYKHLAKSFGKPDLVKSNVFHGPVKMRIYLWTRGDENLELQCEDIGRQLNGNRIELYRSPAGAT